MARARTPTPPEPPPLPPRLESFRAWTSAIFAAARPWIALAVGVWIAVFVKSPSVWQWSIAISALGLTASDLGTRLVDVLLSRDQRKGE